MSHLTYVNLTDALGLGSVKKAPLFVGGAKLGSLYAARERRVLSRAYSQLGAVELVPVVRLRCQRRRGGGFEAQLAELPSNAPQLLGRSHLPQSINHGSERLDMSLGVLGEAGAFLACHGHPVCTENLIRFDLMTESLNVGRDGRGDILPLEPGRVVVQAQELA